MRVYVFFSSWRAKNKDPTISRCGVLVPAISGQIRGIYENDMLWTLRVIYSHSK